MGCCSRRVPRSPALSEKVLPSCSPHRLTSLDHLDSAPGTPPAASNVWKTTARSGAPALDLRLPQPLRPESVVDRSNHLNSKHGSSSNSFWLTGWSRFAKSDEDGGVEEVGRALSPTETEEGGVWTKEVETVALPSKALLRGLSLGKRRGEARQAVPLALTLRPAATSDGSCQSHATTNEQGLHEALMSYQTKAPEPGASNEARGFSPLQPQPSRPQHEHPTGKPMPPSRFTRRPDEPWTRPHNPTQPYGRGPHASPGVIESLAACSSPSYSSGSSIQSSAASSPADLAYPSAVPVTRFRGAPELMALPQTPPPTAPLPPPPTLDYLAAEEQTAQRSRVWDTDGVPMRHPRDRPTTPMGSSHHGNSKTRGGASRSPVPSPAQSATYLPAQGYPHPAAYRSTRPGTASTVASAEGSTMTYGRWA